jgi:hypothetical protein
MKSVLRKNYFNSIPLIITLIPVLTGIINGLRVNPNNELNTGIGDILNRIGLFEKSNINNLSEKIIIHNTSLSLLVGLLGLISIGIFTGPYLFSWWSLWIETIKQHSISKCFFIIPESFGVTIVVLSIIYIGLNYLVYRKYEKYQIILFFIGICLITTFQYYYL